MPFSGKKKRKKTTHYLWRKVKKKSFLLSTPKIPHLILKKSLFVYKFFPRFSIHYVLCIYRIWCFSCCLYFYYFFVLLLYLFLTLFYVHNFFFLVENIYIFYLKKQRYINIQHIKKDCEFFI